jgi:hypothetical protein
MLALVRALSSAGERSLHTGEVVGSIPTAPTICPRKPRAAANAHSFLHAALSYSGERPCETGAVSGGRTRLDVTRQELPHQAHGRAKAFERAHLHEPVRYSFHHVQLVRARDG